MELMHRQEIAAIEKLFVKSGKIIAVRRWVGGGIHEIDIHLPNVDFGKWDTTQSIKCRINALHYTDYTPTLWDSTEKICTLYIDTGHSGQGSAWARNLADGNAFHYLKVEAERHYPTGKHLVFLGDQTGIGHFCALQQLAGSSAVVSGFVTFNDLVTASAFLENCAWLPLHAVTGYDCICDQAAEWMGSHGFEKDDFTCFIVGNMQLVVRLRKLLKAYGVPGRRIQSKGFWQ